MLHLCGHTFPNGYTVKQSYELRDVGLAVILAYNEDKQEYVTAKVSESSLRGNEWYGGHYFDTESLARISYTSRIAELVRFVCDGGNNTGTHISHGTF